MKSLVYIKPGEIAWKEVAMPVINNDNDAIVKVEAFTFSHADFRPYLGQDNNVANNLTMGHEAVGRVVSVGKNVKNISVNDRVIVSSIIHCNECSNCSQKNYANCANGGFILGTKINGTHSEYIRVPFANNSLVKIIENIKSEHAVMLSDIMSTAYDNVISKIDPTKINSVAIIGDGPISMATFILLKMFNLKIDIYGHHQNKLDIYLSNGANKTYLEINNNKYDLVVETVGNDRGTFEQAQQLIADGGTIITIGVFNKPVTFFLNELWWQNITIKTGILSTVNLDKLVKMLENNEINLNPLVSKIYQVDQVLTAYQDFFNKSNFKLVVKI